jgi:hypothetical protein
MDSSNAISKLYDPNAEKTGQLLKTLSSNTPAAVATASKTNNSITKQLLFVTAGTVGVLTYPTLTTDELNNTRLIGNYGDDIDSLAPVAIPGNLLHQSISALVPKATATKFAFPTLEADPLNLEAPGEDAPGPGPDRLHIRFDEPENTPVIAALPALFPVPIGITPPSNWKLNSGTIPEEKFACEAGRAWIQAVAHLDAHHAGMPIHTDAATFNPGDFNTTPFTNLEMAQTVRADIRMLLPTDPQRAYVLSIAREEIAARKTTTPPTQNTPNNQAGPTNNETRNTLESQCNIMAKIVKATLEGVGTKDKESRADRETNTAIKDAKARYQLMLARITEKPDPEDTTKKVKQVHLPELSPVFLEIMETTKLSDAVRMTQEQFAHHLAQRADSRLHQDTTIEFNSHSLDATTVAALKRADWNDSPVTIDPGAIKSKLGVYTLAPQQTDSLTWQKKVEADQLIFQQENVGEDKSRINAKAHTLNHSGRMETSADLHATIANTWAIISFISKEADKSEMWQCILKLQNMWLSTDGKVWLAQQKQTKHLISCLVIEVQAILALFVRIANSLEYRQAVKANNPIDPKAYENANLSALNVVRNANNMIFRMNLGPFIMEPPYCKLFYTGPQKPEPAATPKPGGAGKGQKPNGGNQNGRPAQAAAPGTPDENRPGRLNQEEIELLKKVGLIKYTGPEGGRLAQPLDIFETNGTSGLTKICMNNIVLNRFCRFGAKCNMKHIKNLRDFTTDNKKKFKDFVSNHNHFEMANPGTPN